MAKFVQYTQDIPAVLSNFKAGISLLEISNALAIPYVTVKRILAENGLMVMPQYKTEKEHELIEFLRTKNITDVKSAIRNLK